MNAKDWEQKLLSDEGWKIAIPGMFKGKKIKQARELYAKAQPRGVTEPQLVYEDEADENTYWVYAFSTNAGGLTNQEIQTLRARVAQVPLGNIRHDVAPREGKFEKFEPDNEGFYASYRDVRSLADDLQGVFLYLDADIGDKGKLLSLIVYGYIDGELYFCPIKLKK
jgi:hypothetical protein